MQKSLEGRKRGQVFQGSTLKYERERVMVDISSMRNSSSI
jgi:hypothetical protein